MNHALIVKRPEWARRHSKVILLHGNAPSHTSKPVEDTLKDLAWEVLTYPIAPSDYHLFQSMAQALSEQHFKTYEEVENWDSEWCASKQEKFYWDGIHKLHERWGKFVAIDGHYFE